MFVDYFDPIRRPVEWFLRCARCGEIGPVCNSKSAALTSIA